MKDEPNYVKRKKPRYVWIIDESKCLKEDEVNNIDTYCINSKTLALHKRKFTQIRNWFMAALGLNAGLRVQEMASLQHSNLLIDEERSSINVLGKGNKKRSVWISSRFKELCHTYIKYKKLFGYSTDADSYLLNNLQGNKISKRALQKFFKEIVEKAGLPRHYSVHCLRHTYATFLLKASNYNYRFVQYQLGHASISTTQIYASVLESEGRKAVERLYQ